MFLIFPKTDYFISLLNIYLEWNLHQYPIGETTVNLSRGKTLLNMQTW